jgi:uncharacterized protein
MIRLSSYVVASRLEPGDDFILVHGYSGAIDIVSSSLYQIICHPEKLRDLNSTSTLQIYSRLLRRGYVVSLSEQEEQSDFRQIAGKIHNERCESSRNTFWVIPSYRCNLRCFYCFQEHALHQSTGPQSLVMDSETIEDAFVAMRALGGPFPFGTDRSARYLTLFGGEPLTADTERAVRDITSKALAEGYKVGAVTNGLSLDRFADLLGPLGIRWLQITLDGTQPEHDRRRRSVNKIENFQTVVRNVSLALSSSATVNLRTNFDVALCSEISEIEAMAVRLGWADAPNFTWTVVPLENHLNRMASAAGDVSSIELNKLISEKNLRCVRPPHRDRALAQLESLLEVPIHALIETSSCGAHTGMWFFDPYHRIYSCAEQVGTPELAVGTYEGGALHIDRDSAEIWKGRHVGSVEECSRCGYAFFCGGGCANAARLETGTLFAPRCFGIKEVFDQAASQFAKTNMPSAMSGFNEVSFRDLRMRSLNSDHLVQAQLQPSEYVTAYRDYSLMHPSCAQL